MEIHLVRHTTPEVKKGICYGQTDLELATTFEEEAQQTIALLNKDLKVYASPLKRCELLAQKINSKPILDERLKELNFGDWEMKKWEEIPKVELDNWMNNYFTERPSNGETFKEMEIRLRSFLQEIVFQNEDVIVVTHSGVVKLINGILKKIKKENWMNLKINYGQVISINITT